MPRRRSGLAAAALTALLATSATAQRIGTTTVPSTTLGGGLPTTAASSPVVAPSAPTVASSPAPTAPSLSSNYAPNKAVLSGTGPVYKKSDKLEPVSRENGERAFHPVFFHPSILSCLLFSLSLSPFHSQFFANVYGIPVPEGSNDPDVFVTLEVK